MVFTVPEVQKHVSYKLALQEDIDLYKKDVQLLQYQINNLNKIIDEAMAADSLSQEEVLKQKALVTNYQLIVDALQTKIKGLEKEVRRARRNALWSKITGGLVAAGLGYLYIKK